MIALYTALFERNIKANIHRPFSRYDSAVVFI